MPEIVLRCPLCGSQGSSHFDTRTFREFTVTNRVCDNCGFVFQSPRMNADELENFYQREYRQIYQGKEGPTAKDRFIQGGRAARFVKYLRQHGIRPRRVLDVGSSAGLLLDYLREAFDCEVVGVEPGDAYRQYAEARGFLIYESLEALQQDGQERFDLITLSHVLEHIPLPVAYLEALQDILTDDGVLLIEVPNLYSHDSFEIAHTSAFSPHSIGEVLRLSGYKTIHRWIHGLPRSMLLPLYLTVLARPSGQKSNGVRPERFVKTRRKWGMFRRKVMQRLSPNKAWVPLPKEPKEA